MVSFSDNNINTVRSSAVAVIADRTALSVRYSCRLLSDE